MTEDVQGIGNNMPPESWMENKVFEPKNEISSF